MRPNAQASAQHASPPAARWLAASGACLAAVSVGMAAYAAHAVQGADATRLQTAAAFAFGHGLALAALGPAARRWPVTCALAALLLGTALFSGALAASVLAGVDATTAPLGGMLLIGGWLAWAVLALRGR